MTPPATRTEQQTPEQQAKRISIVIVAFNRAERLAESLKALGSEHQILIVDNGSEDNTSSLEPDFPAARFIRLPKNFGLTKALNIGVRAADGTYILLLHDDAQISSEAVSRLADVLEVRPDIGAVCPLLLDESGSRTPQVRLLPTPSNPDPMLQPVAGNSEIAAECASFAVILFRASYLRALRHIDERYGNYGSEIELSAQLKRSSRKLVVLEEVTALHAQAPSPAKKGSLDGDRVVGTAGFLSKHYGFISGMLYRLKAGLKGVATLRFGVVAGAFSDAKIDGTS